MALFGGFFEPVDGFVDVVRGCEDVAEAVLGLGESLVGGFFEPMEGFLLVGFHSTAFFVGYGEVVLGDFVSGFR